MRVIYDRRGRLAISKAHGKGHNFALARLPGFRILPSCEKEFSPFIVIASMLWFAGCGEKTPQERLGNRPASGG